MLCRACLVLATALLIFSPAPALADDVAGAKRLYESGSKHFDLGEYEEALRDFKEGYRLKDDPVFLYNIAQCQRVLHLRADAVRSYKGYLRRRPTAPNRADVELKIATLEREQAEEAARPKPEPKPEPTPVVTPVAVAAPNIIVAAPPPKKTPIYKKWWLWTAVGGVVVVGLGVGLGVGLTRNRGSVGNTFPGVQF